MCNFQEETVKIFEFYKDMLGTVLMLNGILLVLIILRIFGYLTVIFPSCFPGPAEEILDQSESENKNEGGSEYEEKKLSGAAGVDELKKAGVLFCLPCFGVYARKLVKVALNQSILVEDQSFE